MAMGNMVQMGTWLMSFGFLTSVFQQIIPMVYTDKLRRHFRYWLERLSPYVYYDVHEFANSQRNSLYLDVQMYISSLKVEGAHRMSLSKPKGSKEVTLDLSSDQCTMDTFDGSEMEWVHYVILRARPLFTGFFDESDSEEKKTYTLQIKKKDKERVLNAYIKHIEAKAAEAKLAARHLQLFTNTSSESQHSFFGKGSPWQSVAFMPPANFDTLALDGDLKSRIVSDLDHFAADEQFYKRVGKAWKRGYLLFGPPGTGKSSMIAAIANKLRYDVYDLELTEVKSNAELRTLLLDTSNKSVIVIEDIDCSLDLSGQRKKKKKSKPPATADEKLLPPGMKPPKEEESKVTLSGLLNFVDGLWSCCGSERIFIFTTNYKEKLDPALLRAGRMDMHIYLGYCTFSAFKTLASNYLQITDHELFEKLESAFVGSFMTPAEVSEVLIKNRHGDIAVALESLIVALGEHRVDPSTIKTANSEEDEVSDKDEPQDEKTATAVKDSSCSSPKEVHVVEEKKPITATSSAAAATKSGGIQIVQEPKTETNEENSAKDTTSLIDGSKAQSKTDDVHKERPDATALTTASEVASISLETQA